MEAYKIYRIESRSHIERLIYPRFKGEITFGSHSDIENIEWIDECTDASTLAMAMREAGEYIAANSVHTRGGARPNAGRKSLGKRKLATFRLHMEEYSYVVEQAKKEGISQSALIEKMVAKYRD